MLVVLGTGAVLGVEALRWMLFKGTGMHEWKTSLRKRASLSFKASLGHGPRNP
jgi:hypothetical protein